MSTVTVEVSKDLVNPIIEEKIKGAMLEALGGTDKVVAMVIDRMLHEKVDEHGKKTGYSYQDKFSLIDVALKQAIWTAAKEALNEFIAENKPQLKAELLKQLRTAKSTARLATRLLEGGERAFSKSDAFHIIIGAARKKDSKGNNTDAWKDDLEF